MENSRKTTYIVAFNAFKRGDDVYLLPNKCGFDKDSPWIRPFKVWVENPFERTQEEFKKIINSFEYYNCNDEMGNKLSFYVNSILD